MKVQLIGFEVAMPDAIELGAVELELMEGGDGFFDLANHQRLLRCRTLNGYFEGMLLTIKDQRTIPTIEVSTLELTVDSLEEDQHLIDFNYFRWCSATGRGVMMTYYRSPGLNSLEALFLRAFETVRRRQHEVAIAAATTDREKKQVDKIYRSRPKIQRLKSGKSLEQLINSLDELHALEVEYVGYSHQAVSEYAPLTPFLKRRVERLTFTREARTAARLRAAVRSLARRRADADEPGRIYGTSGGEDLTVRFDRNYDIFGEEDFDTASRQLAVRVSAWTQSPLLTFVRTSMTQHGAIFTAPAAT